MVCPGDRGTVLRLPTRTNRTPASVIETRQFWPSSDSVLLPRDIKTNNVLLDENLTANPTDFGFAKHSWDHRNHQVLLASTDCGTPPCFAPQIHQIHQHQYHNSFAPDYWSIGVLRYCMLHGRYPFFEHDRWELVVTTLNPVEDWSTMHQDKANRWLIRHFHRTCIE